MAGRGVVTTGRRTIIVGAGAVVALTAGAVVVDGGLGAGGVVVGAVGAGDVVGGDVACGGFVVLAPALPHAVTATATTSATARFRPLMTASPVPFALTTGGGANADLIRSQCRVWYGSLEGASAVAAAVPP